MHPYILFIYILTACPILVVHHIVEVDSAIAQIPAVLRGEKNVPCDTEYGTHNFSKLPVAVLVGAWYDELMIKHFQATLDIPTSVHWLWVDKNIPAPPLGPEYSKQVAHRVKTKLLNLISLKKSSTASVILL